MVGNLEELEKMWHEPVSEEQRKEFIKLAREQGHEVSDNVKLGLTDTPIPEKAKKLFLNETQAI